MEQKISLEQFTENDIDNLISWVNSEDELIQFAGTIFTFPLTINQFNDYLKDENRHPFKIVLSHSTEAIGHCEAYQTSNDTVKLSRILIGNKIYRGQGLGYAATRKLVKWCIDHLNPKTIDLNVYDFNTTAIRCYEKIGFKRTAIQQTTKVNDQVWTSVRLLLNVQNQRFD